MCKKKYLFTTLSLTGGGTERVAAVLPGKLADLGYETHLIVYRHAKKEYPVSENLKLHYLDESWESGNPLARLQRNVMQLKALLQEIKPDVIINFVGDMSLYQMYLAAAGSKATFVATVRNHPKKAYKSMRFGWLKNQIHLSLVKRADLCFMQTKEQLDFFSDAVKKKSFVLANPVDDSFLETEYQKREKIEKIVTLGRLNQQKNHKLLIEAFAMVCEQMKDEKNLELHIYGEGEEKEHLQQLAEQLHIAEKVKLCGRTTEPAKVLQEHDLFVLSSDYEGMPNALMEAMAVGIPCISTDCPTGPADMIQNKKNGILVPMKDKKALANAISEMISGPDKAMVMGAKGKKTMQEEYSARTIARKLDKLVQNRKEK